MGKTIYGYFDYIIEYIKEFRCQSGSFITYDNGSTS